MKKNAPQPVIRRLPRYLRKLDELAAAGITRISSAELAERLGLTASQVRQDFSCFGEFGQQGYGYNVKALRSEIARILGMDRDYKIILLGVGNIGRALIDKFRFNDWGFQLVCAFDNNPAIAGTEQNGVPILSEKELEPFLHENKVDAAVLAVTKDFAVEVANVLIACGVDAIWNFTNEEIVEPYSQAIVENIHFSDSLLAMSYCMTERRDNRG